MTRFDCDKSHIAVQPSFPDEVSSKILSICSPIKQDLECDSLRRDLIVAKEVQEASFPRRQHAIPGLRYACYCEPVHALGGDYYDFIPLNTGAWGIAIGDVSGKGIGAALLMAGLQGSLRAHAFYPHLDLEVVMANLNELIWRTSPQHFFVSLFYAEYQPDTRVLRYVNAGHNPPVILRRNHNGHMLLSLAAAFVPLGLLQNSRYKATAIQLESDDILVAYTDGLTERENSDGNEFGQTQLEKLLSNCDFQDPDRILQHILDELSIHSEGCSQADDTTVVVTQVLSRRNLHPMSKTATTTIE